MRHDDTINKLRIAEAIASAEVYVTHSDNRGPQFGFRLWDALTLLSRDEADLLERQLNDATAGVREAWKRRYEDLAGANFAKLRGLGV